MAPPTSIRPVKENHISSLNITICPNRTIMNMGLMENMIYRITKQTFIFPCNCDTLELHRMPIHILESNVIESLATRSLITGNKSGVDIKDLEQVYKNLFKGVSRSTYIDSLATTYFDVRAVSTFMDLGNKSLAELCMFHFTCRFSADLCSVVFQNFPRSKKLWVYIGCVDIIQPSFFEKMDQLSVLEMNEVSIININPYSLSLE